MTESISVREAASLLGVTDRMVRTWLSEGRLQGTRGAGQWTVDARDAERLHQERSASWPRTKSPTALEYAAVMSELRRLQEENERERRARAMLSAQVTELTRILQEMAADQELILGGVMAQRHSGQSGRPVESGHDSVAEVPGLTRSYAPAQGNLGGLAGAPTHELSDGEIREHGE